MPRRDDSGDAYAPGTTFTYDPAKGVVTALPPGVTQAAIDVSNAANPNAAGANGTNFTGDFRDSPTTGTGTSTTPNFVPPDIGSFLAIYGLPSDVQAKVQQIFQNTSDVNQATALAMAYIRGTSWYAQTYPGIQEGIAKGVISNEADYRSYLNNVNTLTKQYLGRDIGSGELGDFLKQGYDAARIGRIYQGGAIAKTNAGDWNYATGAFDENGPLTTDEQAALGQEQAGLDTALGQKVQRRLDLAKQRMSAVFGGGQLATPSLSIANGRLAATSLGGATAPDVSA